MPDEPLDDGPDPILLRRRQVKAKARRRNRMLLIGGSSLFSLVVLIVVIVDRGRDGDGVRRPRFFGPSPSTEGKDWSHTELLAHLQKTGINLEMTPAGGGHLRNGPAAYFYGPETKEQTGGLSGNMENMLALGAGDVCFVQIHDTSQRAKDASGTFGERGWSWGKFSFRVSSGGLLLLKRIQASLS